MNDADLSSGRRPSRSPAMKSLLIAALAACSAAALAGCEEQSYPTPSAEQAPPPAPPPAPLMGAPAPTPPPYAPCAETPCGPSAPMGQPMAPMRVIASTPVPNPPETEHRHRRHARFWTYGAAQPALPHHHFAPHHHDGRWHVVAPAPAYHTHHIHNYAAATTGAAPATVAAPARHMAAAPTSSAVAAKAAAPKKAVAPPPAASAPQAAGGNTVGNITDTTGPSAADADRYNSLQAALSSLIGINASLTTPDHFAPNQTVEVTLTLPANFAQQAHDEATKAGLADAAGSVNIDAHLTGTGFTVTPDQPQAQPLLLGQQTVFHWKVTPTAAAVGAVKAELTADLLTVGRSLPLGSVQSQAGIDNANMSGRLIGIGLLILVLVVVAGWIVSRGGKGPAYRRKDI